jgi:F420-non-reducing hydrogenase large subunit
MTRRVLELEPMTRIEGNIKVTIDLDHEGNVADAHAHLTEFRGFERILVGRYLTKAPLITPRVCGVCPAPHHLASAKALDSGLNIDPTETGRMLRELMLLGAFIHDHILHMFILAGPDILLADLPPEERGFPELLKRIPAQVLRDVVETRAVGQRIVATLGVQATHPMTAVPGGVSKSLSKNDRDRLLNDIREAKKTVNSWYESIILPYFDKTANELRDLGKLETNFVAVTNNGNLEFYDGRPKVVGPSGETVAEFDAKEYLGHIAETPVDYSYAKRCFVKNLGIEKGIYRVGPLARVNVATDSRLDDSRRLLRDFKKKYGRAAQGPLAYNPARYVCTVYAVERAGELLEDERILRADTRVDYEVNEGEGMGIVEAPRGMLVHNYRWDDQGFITMANLVVPTTMNSYAIDSSMRSVAERSIRRGEVDDRRLWHEVGLTVRAYDPCVSCATHIDKALLIQIFDSSHRLLKEVEGR